MSLNTKTEKFYRHVIWIMDTPAMLMVTIATENRNKVWCNHQDNQNGALHIKYCWARNDYMILLQIKLLLQLFCKLLIFECNGDALGTTSTLPRFPLIKCEQRWVAFGILSHTPQKFRIVIAKTRLICLL